MMSEAGLAPDAERAVGNALEKAAYWLALFGGVILAAMALVTVASVIGRAFIFAGLSPIRGDYELVQMGCAIAVFSFLPWCQIKRGHVTVDIFVSGMSKRLQLFWELLGNIALATAAILIAWRLWLGTADKFSYGEETYELGLSVGWGYGLSMIGAILFAVAATYTVWRSVNELMRGEKPADMAA
ncbi:MAG: TRAP transporter small permease [Pseudomonadota bacterium]